MYAWLVLLTGLSWLVFLSFRRGSRPTQCVAYGLLLTALAYSHPLGLFMIAAHSLAYLQVRSALQLPFRGWMAIQMTVLLALVPWLGRYIDHGTDYPMQRSALRFLLAVPIEYIGGNSLVLLVCLAIIVVGLLARGHRSVGLRLTITHPVENCILMTWAAGPPILMYLYSYVSQPIFGPSRYHLFIAPAYLILVAHGLTRLPPLLRWPAAVAGLILSLSLLHGYGPTLKADWRGLAAWLTQEQLRDTTDPITVVVHPSDPRFTREQLEAARYYLRAPFRVVPAAEAIDRTETGPTAIYDVYCLTRPHIENPEPDTREFYALFVKAK
jgi:hypothetical protein